MKFRAVARLLSPLLLLSLPAAAQYRDSWGVPFNNPVSASLSTAIWNNWVVYRNQQQSRTQGAKAVTDETRVRFRPAPGRRAGAGIAEQLGGSAAEKQQIAALADNFFQEFDAQARKLGKPNDLGLALAFFLGLNAAMYNGVAEPEDAQLLELREMLLLALNQNGGLGNMADPQKQDLYDVLVGYTGLAYFGYLDAKSRGDQAHLKQFQRVAGSNLTAITRLSPDRILWTRTGLTIKPQ